jgi:hypothetical protein
MKATIVKHFSLDGRTHYHATTVNHIALTFGTVGDERLELGETLEIDLPNLISNQRVTRTSDGTVIAIQIGSNDMHDLNLPVAHGATRAPTQARLEGA